jgi:hypothetical protein
MFFERREAQAARVSIAPPKSTVKRLLLRFSVVLSALIAFTACSPRKLPSSEAASLGGAGCLTKAHASMHKFIVGTASEAETSGIWDCGIQSLQLFTERTRGETPGIYTAGELRKFLEFFKFVDNPISDDLLNEGMELKRVVIGGKPDSLTLAEITRAEALLETFRVQTLKLRPFMPLTPAAATHLDEAQVDEANRAVLEVAGTIGKSLENTGIPYSFEHLFKLLHGTNVLEAQPGNPRLKLVQGLKNSFISPESDRIGGDEWVLALTTTARAYGILLKYESITHRNPTWLEGPGREPMVGLAHEAFALFDEALARHPRQQLSFGELNNLLEQIIPGGVALEADKVVSVLNIENLLKKVILRVMGGAMEGRTGRSATGLTRAALRRTRDTMDHWSEGQRYIEAMFAAADRAAPSRSGSARGFSAEELLKYTPERLMSLGMLDFSRPVELVDRSATISPVLADAARRIRLMISRDRPMFVGNESLITFSGGPQSALESLHNLSTMNWMYELARLLTRGYAETPERAVTDDDSTQSVNLEEFSRFVQDIGPVAADIKFVDPEDHELAQKRFREAQLFTGAGNGDGYFSSQEGAQLLALMFSGKTLSVRLHEKIVASGCRTNGKDPYGALLVDPPCYRNELFSNDPEKVRFFWKHSPGLANYYLNLDQGERRDFAHAMEDGARKHGFSEELMNSSDSEGFAMIAQYIEGIFSRYDHDGSGTLDMSEASEAFPVFRGTLEELSCQQGHCLTSEKDLRAVFTYMLEHGEAPSKWAFIKWRYLSFSHSISSDRGKIMQIFAALGKPSPH